MTIRRLLIDDLYRHPADCSARIHHVVEKVTTDDVLHVASMHVQPEVLSIVPAGIKQWLDNPLDMFGARTTMDSTSP